VKSDREKIGLTFDNDGEFWSVPSVVIISGSILAVVAENLSVLSRLALTLTDTGRARFCWWGPGANVEDGSSLIIHWSSGSHKRSTNWANQYNIYFMNSIVCMVFSTRVPLPQTLTSGDT